MSQSSTRHHRYAEEHALPFATIFEELLAIRGDDSALPGEKTLTALIDELLPGPGTAHDRLWKQIAKSEHEYGVLEQKKRGKDYRQSEDAACAEADRPLLEILHRVSRTALCLSGGGIRSASFSLGVLQALAQFNPGSGGPCQNGATCSALEEFDYLSTVSGGGYIGSWLMAWTARLAKSEKLSPKAAFQSVSNELAGCAEHTSGDPAPRALRHLREYTSFLAPKLGLTLDTWTLAALVLRNMVVNWAMILPLILALMAGLQTLHFGLFGLSTTIAHYESPLWWWAIGSLVVFSGIMAGYRMPSTNLEDKVKHQLGLGFVFCVFILPLILASIVLIELWLDSGVGWILNRNHIVSRMALATFLTFFSIPVIRGLFAKEGRQVARQEHGLFAYLAAGFGSALMTSVLLSVCVYAVGARAYKYLDPSNPKLTQSSNVDAKTLHAVSPFVYSETKKYPAEQLTRDETTGELQHDRSSFEAGCVVLFAFPTLWVLLIAASALFSGFLGIFEEDVDREWWARAGGLMLCVLGAFVAAEAVVVIAPSMMDFVHKSKVAALAGLVAGLTGALGGASTAGGLGAASLKKGDVSKIGQVLNKFDLLVPALCSLALLVLGLLVAVLELRMASSMNGTESTRVHLEIFLVAAIVGVLINWAININIFSLHGMYRMRLMRAFLGASNTQRVPNPFTGFDDKDNVYEKDMFAGRGLPLHLVNATVNLVGTKKLAWRQRKAEGFTFSPLHCGGWRLGYVKTEKYGRHGGVSLGTAMAISGAAFNPNMGYHSSPLVTLLMTLFNVRLGWWLPNPKYRRSPLQAWICEKLRMPMSGFLEKKAPRLALGPLLREALGGTDDLSAYIELTDGGHFENLGIYEMVMRRAKLIVVVDAGADAKCQLEDLGNALRKIEIDLGIPIVFPDGLCMKAGAHKDNLYCALADIRYEYVDRVSCARSGKLLYIKAGITGAEPPDVTQYARTHPTFPHEATANQFFNEAQFESYRHLGHHAVTTILKQGLRKEMLDDVPAGDVGMQSLQALFNAAQAYTEVSRPADA